MNNMGREECIIQVNEEGWVSQMEEEFKELEQNPSEEEESNRWKAMSIYRIPLSLKNLSKEAYQPQMVAIGPYHHHAEQLKDMEEHKKRALRKFLHRSKKRLHEYVNALTPKACSPNIPLRFSFNSLLREFSRPLPFAAPAPSPSHARISQQPPSPPGNQCTIPPPLLAISSFASQLKLSYLRVNGCSNLVKMRECSFLLCSIFHF